MGKIANALEKGKKDGTLKIQALPVAYPEKTLEKDITPTRFHNPKLIAISAPDSVEAENLKRIKAKILFPNNGERPRTIMVTSALPGEGKTFIAANLALSIAQGINEYTLAVDCDFRRSRLGNMLGYKNDKGLHEYLNGEIKLNEIIIKTRYDKLSLINAGKNVSNPSEILSSIKMQQFIKEIKERYKDRLIIFDTTPVELTSEPETLANFVDGIIFVVKSRKTPKAVVKQSIGKLDRDKIIGIVFNGYSRYFGGYKKYYKSYYQ